MPLYKSILLLCLSVCYTTVSAEQSTDHNFEETLPAVLYLLQDDCQHGINYDETKTVTFTSDCINETYAPKNYIQYYRFIVPAENNNYVINVKSAQGNTIDGTGMNIPVFNGCQVAENNLPENRKSNDYRQATTDTKTHNLNPEKTTNVSEITLTVECHNPGPVDLHIFSQDIDAVLQVTLTHYQP